MLSDELIRATLPTARFHGLTLDAADQVRQAVFWSAALNGTVRDDEGGLRIDPGPGRPAQEILRLRPAPAGQPDGGRVHLDVRLPGDEPTELVAAGARLVRKPGADPWFVLADPEGNEFCAFPSVDDRPPGIFELVVKCRDAHALAAWWAEVLDGTVESEGEAAAVCGAPEFPWDYMVFDPVPEPKVRKNRLHWHLVLRDDDPSALLAAGASVVDGPAVGLNRWVLADPEGNEFCAPVGRSADQ